MKVSRVWEILAKFKSFCRHEGWKTSENEDWIEIEGSYHNFLWTREVSPESFRKIVSAKKCSVREGLAYHTVEAAYTAWLFSDTMPERFVKTVYENPDFSKRIALYDLSQKEEGKGVCSRLNNTDSSVFQEFENFLKKELKLKLKTISILSDEDVNAEAYATPAIA